jgi:hypothetical protein
MNYTSHFDSLCCSCKQEEQAKLLVELDSLAARAREEELILEAQLARWLKETDIPHQQLMKQMADHRVSNKWLQSYLKQSLYFLILLSLGKENCSSVIVH